MAFHLRRDIWLRCPSLIFRQRGSREYNEDKGVCIGASPCCGSSHITPTKMTSFLDTLAERGIKADFAPGFTLDMEPALESEAVETAKNADVVLMFLGLPEAAESEGFDRDTLDMPAKQIALLEQVATANQNVVVVLSNGSVVSVAPWAKNAKGILESWLLGQSGGPALADVIFGQVSPSGKLAQSIPLDINDDPSMTNWPGEEGHVDYGEGVFVGYRYYDTYGKAVDYPFGYGLSYATFEIVDVTAVKTGANTATVTATVTNTSDVDAAETVQVYVAPGKADVARPKHELKGFTKVFLKAGGSKTVTIDLDERGQDGHAFGLHQNRSNIQERTGLVHVLREVKATHISQEFLGDRGERNLGQLELVVGDHAEQRIERPGIDLKIHLEAGAYGGLDFLLLAYESFAHQATMPRDTSSRATSRYSLAVLCPGA